MQSPYRDPQSLREPGGFTPVAALVDQLTCRLAADPTGGMLRLAALWRELAGPVLAACSEPVGVNRDLLTVRVISPVWATQLSFLRPQLLARLQREDGLRHLRDVRFVTGELRYRPATPPPPPAPDPDPEPEELRQAQEWTRVLQDPELRATLQRMALMFLVRHRGEGRTADAPPG
ncbi:MAG: DUF721 domain-containing protein [Magnetococcus sp. WYHC-3]